MLQGHQNNAYALPMEWLRVFSGFFFGNMDGDIELNHKTLSAPRL